MLSPGHIWTWSCCPAGRPGGKRAQPAPIQLESVTQPCCGPDARVALESPAVWPVTRAARTLCFEPLCKQWLYKVSREDTLGWEEAPHCGREAGNPGGCGRSWKKQREEETAERGGFSCRRNMPCRGERPVWAQASPLQSQGRLPCWMHIQGLKKGLDC